MNYTDVKKQHTKTLHDGIMKIEAEEQILWRKRIIEEEGEKREGIAYLSPHAASIIVPGPGEFKHLEGSCRRSEWFKKMEIPVSDPIPPNQYRKMTIGKSIEKDEHRYADSAGMTVAHNMRISHVITPTCIIKGEVDSILNSESGKYVLEIKSFYGYQPRKEIFGSKDSGGRPKISHLMQLTIYLSILAEKDPSIKFAIMHYIDRTDAENCQFVIELEDNKTDVHPIIDGATYRDISLKQIYTRYLELGEYIINKEIPPRDASPIWSEERIKAAHNDGSISKTMFTDWQNGKAKPGDWNCSYCNYKTLCIGKDKTCPKDVKKILEEITQYIKK